MSAGGQPPPWPDEAGLVEFTVQAIRDVRSDVEHVPLRQPTHPVDNYAHCQLTIPLEGVVSVKNEVVVKPRFT